MKTPTIYLDVALTYCLSDHGMKLKEEYFNDKPKENYKEYLRQSEMEYHRRDSAAGVSVPRRSQ